MYCTVVVKLDRTLWDRLRLILVCVWDSELCVLCSELIRVGNRSTAQHCNGELVEASIMKMTNNCYIFKFYYRNGDAVCLNKKKIYISISISTYYIILYYIRSSFCAYTFYPYLNDMHFVYYFFYYQNGKC